MLCVLPLTIHTKKTKILEKISSFFFIFFFFDEIPRLDRENLRKFSSPIYHA